MVHVRNREEAISQDVDQRGAGKQEWKRKVR